MKKLLPIIFICFVLKLSAQQGMYRIFPQTTASNYFMCGMKPAVKTQDGGYVFSYLPWTFSLHGLPNVLSYTIKTDSNFIPQWKKPYYASSIPLPTGGIILLYNNTIEKITASGAQIWIKQLSNSEAIILNDGVSYSNKLRTVGRKSSTYSPPFQPGTIFPTSQAYTLLMDTSGNLLSQSFYNTTTTITYPPSYTTSGNVDFCRIKRDSDGNFYTFSNEDDLVLSASEMTLVKFDSSFNFLWAKAWAPTSSRFTITDLDVLSGGNIFASGHTNYNKPSFVKLDFQGNVISQSSFDYRSRISGLTKKSNGRYIISMLGADSVFVAEIDTLVNVYWNKFSSKANAIGTSVIQNNKIYTPVFFKSRPTIFSNDINGNSCGSSLSGYTQGTSSISLINFTLSPAPALASLISGTINVLSTQSYADSCNCPVSFPINQNELCVGNTGTVHVIASGNLSWYSTALGNTFIQSGSQFVFTSNTPTVKTVYVLDSTCNLNFYRMPINFVVHDTPNLIFSPQNPTICAGQQVYVTVSGAMSYTWSNVSQNYPFQNFSPSSTSNYTVTGSVAPGCSNTKTMSVFVVPTISLSVNSPTSVCLGNTATVTLNGADTYTYNNLALSNSSFIVTPTLTGSSVMQITGSNGFCTSASQKTIQTFANPTITVSGTDSICEGQTTTITALGADSYSWSNGQSSGSFTYTPLSGISNYTVTGFNTFGCSDTKTIGITVHPLPTLNLNSSSPTLCVGETSTLTASGAQSYTWNTGTVHPDLVVSPASSTSYSLIASDHNGCSATAIILQYVDICSSINSSLADNSFIQVSPNPGSGYFILNMSSIPANTKLEIYNSIGQLVLSQMVEDKTVPIDLSAWCSGVYYLKVVDQSKLYTTKIVKH